MILVLIISMAISFGIKDWIAGGVIAGVIAINVIVGFIQEFQAEKQWTPSDPSLLQPLVSLEMVSTKPLLPLKSSQVTW